MKRLAIFGSGTGSNARAILEHFQNHKEVEIVLVASNKEEAGILNHALDFGVETLLLTKSDLHSGASLRYLKAKGVNFIILAGYLWLIPEEMIEAFPNRIINIHPALLPNFGGKGMYGKHVHRAVSESGADKTGITIHFVNKEYDKGEVIAQYSVEIEPGESPETIEEKVRKLELKHYPNCIGNTVKASL